MSAAPDLRLVPCSPVILRVVPALAAEIGVNESIVLLQLEWWQRVGKERDGSRWVCKSAQAMRDDAFPFWSVTTIGRAITRLVALGLVREANYNEHSYDKTRWLSLAPEGLARLQSVAVHDAAMMQAAPPIVQNEQSIVHPASSIVQDEPTIHKTDQRDIQEIRKEQNNKQGAAGASPAAVVVSAGAHLILTSAPESPDRAVREGVDASRELADARPQDAPNPPIAPAPLPPAVARLVAERGLARLSATSDLALYGGAERAERLAVHALNDPEVRQPERWWRWAMAQGFEPAQARASPERLAGRTSDMLSDWQIVS